MRRNFSDESFLLYFANEHPDAFRQVAGEFQEFAGDWMEDLLPKAPKKWRLHEFAKRRKLALGRKMMRFKENRYNV